MNMSKKIFHGPQKPPLSVHFDWTMDPMNKGVAHDMCVIHSLPVEYDPCIQISLRNMHKGRILHK